MTSKIEKWIKTGYHLLATDEIDGINIEKLSKALKANKSGFYHYFGSREEYLKSMVKFHIDRAQIVANEIRHCETIDPDLLMLIVKEKTFFLVEAQLLLNGKRLKVQLDTTEASRIIADELIALWRKYNEPSGDVKGALATVDIFRHFFYARVSAQNVSYKFLQGLLEEIKELPSVHIYGNYHIRTNRTEETGDRKTP